MTSDATSTQLCNRCQTTVAEQDAFYCRVCGRVHHVSCWNDAGGRCATPDCPGIQAVRMQSSEIGIAPPPPISVTPTLYNTVPGFVNEVGLGASLSNGWAAFRDNMGLCIGLLLLLIVIMIPIAIIPFLNLFLMIFLGTVIFGGIYILGLNITYRRNPSVGDMFAGFQNYGRWLGSMLLYGVITTAIMLPSIVWVIVRMIQTGYFTSPPSNDPFAVYTIGGPVYYVLYIGGMILLYILMMRWYFYFPLIAEGAGIMEAFGKSVEMTEGIRWRLFGISIVLGLIYLAGFVTCIGWLFTLPLIGLAYIALYVAAKNRMIGPQF